MLFEIAVKKEVIVFLLPFMVESFTGNKHEATERVPQSFEKT